MNLINDGSRICKLCHKNAVLCDSHIIPDSFCDTIVNNNNPKHQVIQIWPDTYRRKIKQNSFHEFMLCNDCEQKLSRYENYTISQLRNNLWQSATVVNHSVGHNTEIGKVNGLDYKLFKLCYLSIFWRMSVSEDMHIPDIGERHRENLRQLIITDNPGTFDRYSLIFSRAKINDKEFVGCSGYWGSGRLGNAHRVHAMICRGFLVMVCLGAIPIPVSMQPYCFLEDGSFIIGEIPLESMSATIDTANKIRTIHERLKNRMRNPTV